MINNICLLTWDYPTPTDPVYSFVEQLCIEFANNGADVTVIAPQSLTSKLLHRKAIRPKFTSHSYGASVVMVYQPYYITLPYKYKRINDYLYSCAAKRVVKKLKTKFDVAYAHFWTPGFIAYKLFNKDKLPLYIATGESDISNMFSFNRRIESFKEYVTGVIAVSSKNKEESISLNLTTENKVRVFPNAIDNTLFYKRDKIQCRRELGLKEDIFIVAFVGWFIDRKGSKRVARAIEMAGDDIFSIFIGEGEDDPDCGNIIFKGKLPHNQIPIYLNAADVFVLPTKKEGCCNAVIEAMACGLPIISSDLSFNWDVLNKTNSILVNPENIDEIAAAIRALRGNNPLRAKLSEGAIESAKNLTIQQRAKSIMDFMDSN